MKRFMPFILVTMLLLACRQNQANDSDIYYSTPISLEELLENYSNYRIDSRNASIATKIGAFFPEDTSCSKKIKVQPALTFEGLDFKGIQTNNPKTTLYKLLDRLYKLFGDPMSVDDENYVYGKLPIEEVIDSLKTGQWAPQCGGISNISNRIIASYLTDFETTIISLDYPVHTVSGIEFISKNQAYALVLDAQNGFLFPVDAKGEFVSIDTLKWKSEMKVVEELSFLWLEEDVLLQKRNLLNQILPCNILVDGKNDYHFSPENSPYKFDRLSYSFHKNLWFDLGFIDIDSMKVDLVKKMLDNYVD